MVVKLRAVYKHGGKEGISASSAVCSQDVFAEQGEDDPGRMGVDGIENEEGGKAERTGRDRRQKGRWRREVRVTAAKKGSE